MNHNANERYQGVFEDFLLSKEASDKSSYTPGDEDESTVGVNSGQQPKPQGRGENTIDAPWGDNPAPESSSNKVVHHSDATVQGFIQSRQQILDELFDSKKPAAKAEQALVGEQFEHGRTGEYESKSPLLEKGARDQTLSERVSGLLG
jgi:hypothetical protein